jgi:hypothetical protein
LAYDSVKAGFGFCSKEMRIIIVTQAQVIFMVNILLGSVLTGLLFLTFLYLLVAGLRKRRKRSVYVSVVFLCLTLGTGVFTSYLFVSKAYNKVKNVRVENPFKARTGNEIYTALFGVPEQNCVEVINKMDQIVPRLDCCIWLEFKTCPSEVQRIVAQEPYEKSVLGVADTSRYIPSYSPKPEWFNPAALGDSIILLQHYNPDNPNRDQILLLSKESTHAFYCDMAD